MQSRDDAVLKWDDRDGEKGTNLDCFEGKVNRCKEKINLELKIIPRFFFFNG